MSASRGLRVAIAGATGTLGSELLAVLDERRFPVSDLRPIASERSLPDAVEFQGETFDVETGTPSLRGVDLIFLCAPPGASLDLVRVALRESVACIDLSGALSGSSDVPLVVADLSPTREALRSPVLAAPAGPALAWALALAPIARAVGLVRVIGTGLESASTAGRAGIEALSSESVALFNQQDVPESSPFVQPIAFNCLPGLGEVDAAGDTAHERAVARDLRRLLGEAVHVAVTTVHVPVFTSSGAALAVETERPLDVADARVRLAKAPGVEGFDGDLVGPSTRAAAGRDVVLVGRLRRDPSTERGLLLWVSADLVRLAAVNGVRLAESRMTAE